MAEIKRVVLYKHGVGQFEREATIAENGELKLSFRTEEMNDVLKSLTVYDEGGGAVTSVSYDNKKPLSKLLEEISLDLPGDGGSLELLGALRGAKVAVTVGARTIPGQIVGIDERLSSRGDLTCQRHLLTIFDELGRLQSFDLDEVGNVAFLDQSLQEEMRFFFQTLFSAKKQDAKALKIFSRGEGERRLRISYVVECPVWKTSYRIALPAPEEENTASIQGWALVDNPQDEDWSEVELSLVSGLPISFRHDLYSPRYLHRKEIRVERESSAGPVMAEGDLFDAGEADLSGFDELFSEEGSDHSARAEALLSGPHGAKMAFKSALGGREGRVRAGAAQVEAVTQKVGQLFEYKIDRPVTVPRNQSALVPIVSEEFEGGKRLLYNERERAENPFSVVDFKNTTGLTLEGGPVTVFEGGIYAGEAMMDTVMPGEERMLPYAVAMDVEVKTEFDQSSRSIHQSINNGVWKQQRATYRTTTYRFINRGEMKRKVVVEHPLSDAELVDTPKPISETRNYRRFEIEVEPDATAALNVKEKTVHHEATGFSNAPLENIYTLVEGAAADSEGAPLLRELRELLERERQLSSTSATLARRAAAIEKEQARIRENLKSLGDSQEERALRSRYVGSLDADETQFVDLREELERTQAALQEVRERFRHKAEEVSLERVFE